ncbi:MAG TPA: UDP-N-acetylmuramoyl-L-alanyl-D-glutamate--2,6-diaminopimelate ligase [Candidatus Baltobacteraceae bacterium]|jgi:UDP-N-acetylmuramoyl-L-alanyl-D-glutamate--2,6-diaminopimelate ligase|nr:UDP-N-acetylmuramoyl-L-alanyl-D-glutamate--2,6-diaminopimelate ligase [Candidatus Baltobacteraceae bacterium]
MTAERSAMLEELLHALTPTPQIVGSLDLVATGIAIDSRNTRPGEIFVALPGTQVDGHRFAAQAVERGATAVVVHRTLPELAVTQIIVPDTARALSALADAFYGQPSKHLMVTGITGTNGKTTTAQMTAAILDAGGLACGSIGTIGARFREHAWNIANTTPPASELHALLAQMRESGARAVAMEVSSHALALGRVADVRYHTGALTNITRDHLDFHGSFDAYAAAKRILFDKAQRCVFNTDDALGKAWASEFRARKPVLTYAIETHAQLNPQNMQVRPDGSTFVLHGQRFDVRLPGRFNVANALCAIGIGRHLDVADRDAARGLAGVESVRGRMEVVRGSGGFDVVVDYAHTPDALENALKTLRETTAARLIVVFGCGGDRDRGKRPQMGAVAAANADFAYVTSDNPRSEDPLAIIEEIESGMNGAQRAVCPDRRAAIAAAIEAAKRGDVILVAGKGHENYQIIGEDVLEFDDVQSAREAIARKERAR